MSCLIDQFRERLVYQYRDSPRVVATVDAMLSGYIDICDAQKQLLTRLDIDLSEGVQLDGIGEIVGRPRPNTEDLESDDLFVMRDPGVPTVTWDSGPADSSEATWNSFEDVYTQRLHPTPPASATTDTYTKTLFFENGTEIGLGFSNLANPTIGGRFIGEDGNELGPMPDQDYRVLLRAAIFGNYANASVQDIVDYVTFVLGARVFLDEGIGVVNFQFDRVLRPFEDRIVRATVPLAAGVRVGTLTSYEPFILSDAETLETSDNIVYEVIISEAGT